MTQNTSKELNQLIKLLKMTTSGVDGEAISAMRLANQQLVKNFGGDWEAFMLGHVKVIADPFSGIPTMQPSSKPDMSASYRAPPPRQQPSYANPHNVQPQAGPTPRQSYTPQPPPKPFIPTYVVNKFSGTCYHCHTRVGEQKGWARSTPGGGWSVVCQQDDSCITNPARRAPQPFKAPKRGQRVRTDDLLNF